MYCLGDDDFNDNFPPDFLSPTSVTSKVPLLNDGLSYVDIILCLRQCCSDFQHIMKLYVARGFSYEGDATILTGPKYLNTLYIQWKGADFMGEMDAALSLLVGPVAWRKHERLQGLEPGLSGLLELNSLMILLSAGPDGRTKPKYPAPRSRPAPTLKLSGLSPSIRKSGPAPTLTPARPYTPSVAVLNTSPVPEHFRPSYSAAVNRLSHSTPSSPFGSPAALALTGVSRQDTPRIQSSLSARPFPQIPEPGPGALVDMSVFDSLINARVASAVEAQLAPMREQLASQNTTLVNQHATLSSGIQALDARVAGIDAKIDGTVKKSIQSAMDSPEYLQSMAALFKYVQGNGASSSSALPSTNGQNDNAGIPNSF